MNRNRPFGEKNKERTRKRGKTEPKKKQSAA